VLREFRPALAGLLDFRRRELVSAFLPVRFDEEPERGLRVGVVLLRLLELRRGPRDGARRGLGFARSLMRCWWSFASSAVGNAARWRLPSESRQSAMNFPHFFCMVVSLEWGRG